LVHSKTRRFLPPLSLPLDPVILNELVLSLRSTSEMKDLLVDAGIGIRGNKGKKKSMNQAPWSGNKILYLSDNQSSRLPSGETFSTIFHTSPKLKFTTMPSSRLVKKKQS
jgi:hypothetical protein